ncbi:U-box domain-containing protein 39-like [Phragmites australis]|uniref:U-box domain-containing protein 39-like n=1 Tax=Phragmites australis TaxID=29695 RepID=UPI002D79D77B|nr:U-box domain-containing protein 39-like [Phragmites australis]
MGAERAQRWKLLPFRFAPAAAKPKHRAPDVLVLSAPTRKEEEEEVPGEFLCPILGAPMADPVILPSGRTYERACVQACAELGLSLGTNGVVGEEPGGAGAVAIPNNALRAAVRTWCARSGRAAPVAPFAEEARKAVLRAARVPPARSASNLSCSSEGASAASTPSSSSAGSSTEMAAGEVVRGKEAMKEREEEFIRIEEAEEEVLAKAVEAGDEGEVEAAMAALRRATRDGKARRRELCGSRLLAALRRVLLSSRHTASARADAAAALANLSLEPENTVPIVRAGAVPALIEVLASAAAPPEAREHAAGALFGLALHEENRAAIGVLGAVPLLLAVLTTCDHALRARRDAGMALYHLSLAAVNQSKLARAPGAGRSLLSVASNVAEPSPIRRLALMVICNVAACVEGRTALMDAGAVATVSAILSDDARNSDLQEWCVAALYAMSRGSPRFRGLARAAGADRPLILIAEHAHAGVHKEMAQMALRAMLDLGDNSDGDLSDCRNSEGNYGGGSFASAPSHSHRRRAASWASAATPPSSHHWRSVFID